MNRLHVDSIVPSESLPAVPPLLEADGGRFAVHEADAPYAVFAPLHYEASYAYPVIVWLHGPRDDEGQLRRIMPLVSLRNYVAVAPRGTDHAASAGERARYTWADDEFSTHRAEQRVFEALERLGQKLCWNRRRVFVAGFDCGGTMALRVALANPRQFAGVLSLGGALPAGRTPLARLAEIRSLPLFVACGKDSQRYAPDAVCRDLKLYHAAGIRVSLRQYPCGDEITSHMLRDMDRWIMERVCAVA